MATKKGSKVNKSNQRFLRLEVVAPGGQWGKIAEADCSSKDALDWITELAATMKKGKQKYRLVETTITTRQTSSEVVLEGEGAKKPPTGNGAGE